MKKRHSLYNRAILIPLTIFIIIINTGCFDLKEVDDLAYVTGIGLDKGMENNIILTLQIAIPKNFSGEGQGSDSENSVTLTSVECPSIYSGLNMISNYISKQLNLSHAKVLVISKELAMEEVNKYIHSLTRGREFRGNMNLLISIGSAKEYLKNEMPLLEINPAKNMELKYESFNYTSFTTDSTLINFYLMEECSCSQAVATLGSVQKNTMEDDNKENKKISSHEIDYYNEGIYKAGNIPRTGETKSEIMGLAVFDGSKMVGELNGEETTYYLMLTGLYNYAYITIPDPMGKNSFAVLNVKKSRDTVKKAKIQEKKPVLTADIFLEADILTIESSFNYEENNNLKILEKAYEEYIEKGIIKMLLKTAKDFESDICSFGKILKSNYITWDEWTEFNWLNKYKDSTFDVNVDLKIRRPGLLVRSFPVYSKNGLEEY